MRTIYTATFQLRRQPWLRQHSCQQARSAVQTSNHPSRVAAWLWCLAGNRRLWPDLWHPGSSATMDQHLPILARSTLTPIGDWVNRIHCLAPSSLNQNFRKLMAASNLALSLATAAATAIAVVFLHLNGCSTWSCFG